MDKLTKFRIVISNYWLLSVGGTYIYIDKTEYKKPIIEKAKLALCGPFIPFIIVGNYLDSKYSDYKYKKN
jgi:hypothetical protein